MAVQIFAAPENLRAFHVQYIYAAKKIIFRRIDQVGRLLVGCRDSCVMIPPFANISLVVHLFDIFLSLFPGDFFDF